MENNIRISIVTICLNSEKTISDTLESVLNQTYSNYEYIIIDGQSTDNTLDIINSYKEKFGDRLKVISEKDNGIADAMNKGLQYCKGDIIGFINADDWYEVDAFEKVANLYDSKCHQVIYGMIKEYENDVEKICYIKKHEYLPYQAMAFPSIFITRSIYEKYGYYNTQYASSLDYDFLLKLFYAKNIDFIPVYYPIANFRLGGLSGTNIGAIETAKIRYSYQIISKVKKNKIVFIQTCKIIIKKSLKKMGLQNITKK